MIRIGGTDFMKIRIGGIVPLSIIMFRYPWLIYDCKFGFLDEMLDTRFRIPDKWFASL